MPTENVQDLDGITRHKWMHIRLWSGKSNIRYPKTDVYIDVGVCVYIYTCIPDAILIKILPQNVWLLVNIIWKL
jgi:hypothetical protein